MQEQLERHFAIRGILRAQGCDHLVDKLEQLLDVGGWFFVLDSDRKHRIISSVKARAEV